jgi:hypothetical protein
MPNKKPLVSLIALGLMLTLIVSGCGNLPGSKPTPTNAPTDTPLAPAAQPTSTFTPVPPPPTPTATNTPVSVAEAETPTKTSGEGEGEASSPTNTPSSEEAPSTPTSPPPTATPVPKPKELLENGGFEAGFGDDGVANGWTGFSNGQAGFVWYDDTWDLVVPEGEHSQLISIIDPAHNDRYVGIFQTVGVIPGKPYQLSMHGLVRANSPADQYGHRLYVGVDHAGTSDWQAVENWVELPWDQQPLVADAFTINSFSTVITPTGKSLTLFIRGHSKWPRNSEANFNLDNVSLWGVSGTGGTTEPTMPVTGRTDVNWAPIAGLVILVLILFREGWRGLSGGHRA